MKSQTLTILTLSVSQAVALLSQDVVKALGELTSLSSDTNNIATGLEVNNLADDLPKVTDNFKSIVQMSLQDIKALSGDSSQSSFGESEQGDVCQAFSEFVQVHQNLLKTISGKNSILSTNQLTVSLAAVLRVLEGAVDNLAYNVIKTVPTCQDKANQDIKSLDDTLNETSGGLDQILPGGSGSVAGGLTGIANDLGSSTANGQKKRRNAAASGMTTMVRRSAALSTAIAASSIGDDATKNLLGRGLRDPAGPEGGIDRLSSELASQTDVPGLEKVASSGSAIVPESQPTGVIETPKRELVGRGREKPQVSFKFSTVSPETLRSQGGASDGSTGGLLGGLVGP